LYTLTVPAVLARDERILEDLFMPLEVPVSLTEGEAV
jgi:hypothetical protein